MAESVMTISTRYTLTRCLKSCRLLFLTMHCSHHSLSALFIGKFLHVTERKYFLKF